MQENTMCFSKLDKPGKDEKPQFMPRWITIKTCPDCDSKRIGVRKDPNCNKVKH